MNSCESCGSTENLIEYSQREASGGQFCGGDWWICKKCDDEATKAAMYYNKLFRKQTEREKHGSKD